MKLSPDDIERLRKMVPTIRELRTIDILRDYRAIRARAFGKSIPPAEDIAIMLLSKREMSRMSGAEDPLGGCLSGFAGKLLTPFVITIFEELGEIETRTTLLHEMGHLKVNIKHGRNMHHGKLWIAEMHRLVRIGEMDAWF
jgi:hypothetical protein